jgi:hypothetical protein
MLTGTQNGSAKTKTVSPETEVYLEHRRTVSAAKRVQYRALDAQSRPDRLKAVPIRQGECGTPGWQIERRRRAYELELQGKSRPEIAAELKMTPSMVRHVLARAHQESRAQLAKTVNLYRQLELDRTELLIKRYLAIALPDPVTIQRLEGEEPVAAASLDHAMKAALIVLELLKYEARLLGLYTNPKMPPAENPGALLEWLRLSSGSALAAFALCAPARPKGHPYEHRRRGR